MKLILSVKQPEQASVVDELAMPAKRGAQNAASKGSGQSARLYNGPMNEINRLLRSIEDNEIRLSASDFKVISSNFSAIEKKLNQILRAED